MSLRLTVFALLLLPPFLKIGFTYFWDTRIQRRIRFGAERCNFLDVYSPEAAVARGSKGAPVVVAIMGGAWVIGHRAWNAQLGQRFMDAGVLTMAVDYRNFPRAAVPDMVEDLSRGLAWVFANVERYGGDPSNVVITGGWSPADLRGFVGVSGPYDLSTLGQHLDSRWMSRCLLRLICPGGNLERHSPLQLLRGAEAEVAASAVRLLPPMLLFHGEADKTVPVSSCLDFATALRGAGAERVAADVRPGLAHAEPIIEGPLRGEDHQVQLLLPILFGEEASRRFDSMPPLRPMYPRCIVNAASRVMPF